MSNEYSPARLLLIRGLPGSGKSTLAKTVYIPQGYKHFEADMFFMRGGEYRFNHNALGHAHEWCLNETISALNVGASVVVTNTFTTHREINPYMKAAMDRHIPFNVIHAKGNFKNVHDVPSEALDRMKARWQAFTNEEIYVPNV